VGNPAATNQEFLRMFHYASIAYIESSKAGSGTARPIYITLGGAVAAQITTAGAWRWNAYGAGALTTDASGNITAVSDESVKSNIRPYRAGLEQLAGITPILHGYTVASGLDQTKHDYAGFSAQNVLAVMPEAIGKMSDGNLTLNDRPILAASVNAINELNERIKQLEKIITQ